jgi:hypothetical protein
MFSPTALYSKSHARQERHNDQRENSELLFLKQAVTANPSDSYIKRGGQRPVYHSAADRNQTQLQRLNRLWKNSIQCGF